MRMTASQGPWGPFQWGPNHENKAPMTTTWGLRGPKHAGLSRGLTWLCSAYSLDAARFISKFAVKCTYLFHAWRLQNLRATHEFHEAPPNGAFRGGRERPPGLHHTAYRSRRSRNRKGYGLVTRCCRADDVFSMRISTMVIFVAAEKTPYIETSRPQSIRTISLQRLSVIGARSVER